jgi:cysteine desulfurase
MAHAFVEGDGPKRLAVLRDRLERGMLARVDESGVYGGDVARVPNTTNIWFDYLEGEALVIALDLKGLAVSGGSACQSGASSPSHVLSALGAVPGRAGASLRFSLDTSATDRDVDFALEVVPAAVARLRELSPFYKPPVKAPAAGEPAGSAI